MKKNKYTYYRVKRGETLDMNCPPEQYNHPEFAAIEMA